jgi:uncharacterized membrane protein YphA (DoxX/SURF4 family)
LSYLVLTLRGLLAGVFLVSVVGKVRGRESFTSFTGAVRRIGRVPDRFATPVAAGMVALEAGIVALLAVPGAETAGFVVAAVTLLGLATVLAAALRRGTTAPCRCFGVTDAPIARRHVWRNAVLAACAVGGGLLAPSAGELSMHPAAVPLCLVGAVVAVAGVVFLDDLAYLLR